MYVINRIRTLFSGTNWLIIPAALLAIIFHELAHGATAYLLGDRTARDNERLSLNPLKHIDPLGLICMIFFGFGWAKPVPINPTHFKNRRFGLLAVSLAGPLSNFLMAFLSLFSANLILTVLNPQGSLIISFLLLVVEFFFVSALLNIGLAVFNLIPIPPLDGSKILFSFLPHSAIRFILCFERYGMIILLVLINLPFFSNFLADVRSWLFSAINAIVSFIIT